VSERHRLRSLGTLVQLNGLIPIRTQPLYLVNLLASPLSFLFFIDVISHGALIAYGITGGLVLTMLSAGTGLQSDLTHYRHDLKFQDVVVASPVEAPVYVLGMALSELVYSLPGIAVFVALFVARGLATLESAVVVGGVLLLVWGFATALAFTLATYFEDVRETFMFSPLISLLLTVLPPVYYPLSYLPGWAQVVARFSPTTYAANLVQGVAIPGRSITIAAAATDWLVLGAVTAALFLVAAFKARWKEP
jgi:ABC-2 type transport system permease protein